MLRARGGKEYMRLSRLYAPSCKKEARKYEFLDVPHERLQRDIFLAGAINSKTELANSSNITISKGGGYIGLARQRPFV